MRRLIALAVALALLLPVLPASAQSPAYRITSGGVLNYSLASASVSNTTAATTLYSYTVPGSVVATQSLATSLLATQSGWNWTGTVPVHAILKGRLSTNVGNGSPGPLSIGVSYGGATATISLVNSVTPNGTLSFVPWRIDAYIEPIASATGANTVRLRGRMVYSPGTPGSVSFATENAFNAVVTGTTVLSKDQTFLVSVQWASATQVNSVVLDNVLWKLGE